MGRGWGGGLLGLMRGVRSRSFVFRLCMTRFLLHGGRAAPVCSWVCFGVDDGMYTQRLDRVFRSLLCVTDIAFHFLAELVNEFWFGTLVQFG